MRRAAVLTLTLAALTVGGAQAAPAETVLGARTVQLRPSGIPVTLVVSKIVLRPGPTGRVALWLTLRDGRATPGRVIKRVRAPVEGFPLASRLVSLTVRLSSAPNMAIFTIRWLVTPSVGTIGLNYAATTTSLVGPVN